MPLKLCATCRPTLPLNGSRQLPPLFNTDERRRARQSRRLSSSSPPVDHRCRRRPSSPSIRFRASSRLSSCRRVQATVVLRALDSVDATPAAFSVFAAVVVALVDRCRETSNSAIVCLLVVVISGGQSTADRDYSRHCRLFRPAASRFLRTRATPPPLLGLVQLDDRRWRPHF